MFNLEGEHVYKSSTITKEVDFKDVVTHVNFIQSDCLMKLSMVDINYLETYFTSANTSTTNSDDEGRRVHLVQSRSGRLRRVVTFSTWLVNEVYFQFVKLFLFPQEHSVSIFF